jgi:hypothetical protein
MLMPQLNYNEYLKEEGGSFTGLITSTLSLAT